MVRATLAVLVAFVRKTNHSPSRFTGNHELNTRLLSMAQGWGGKEQVGSLFSNCNQRQAGAHLLLGPRDIVSASECSDGTFVQGLELVACASADETHIQQVKHN